MIFSSCTRSSYLDKILLGSAIFNWPKKNTRLYWKKNHSRFWLKDRHKHNWQKENYNTGWSPYFQSAIPSCHVCLNVIMVIALKFKIKFGQHFMCINFKLKPEKFVFLKKEKKRVQYQIWPAFLLSLTMCLNIKWTALCELKSLNGN